MAALTTLQNGTSSNQNLNSGTGVQIQGYAATAGQRLQPRVYIAQLNGAAATLTLGIRNTTDGSWVDRWTWIKGTTADTIAEPPFPAFLANAKTYAIAIHSSNTSDTTTPDVTVDWFDVQKVDLDAVKGTSANATGLGVLGGDYGANARVDANITQINFINVATNGSGLVTFPRGTEISTLTAADVNAQCDTALTDYGALKPTTAGRTLDVSTGGEAGIDWANIGSPTTTVNLSGTTTSVVGSITGVTFPANFGGFTIHADGYAEANVVRVTGNVNSAAGLADLGATYDLENHVNAHVVLMSTDVISAASVSSAAVTKIQGSLSTLAAADIRTAVGLASANLDTQLSAILADTNELQLDWVNGGRLDLILDASAASASTAATNAINANTNTNTIITNLATVDGIVDDIKAVTVKMDTMLVADDANWQFTQAAGELFVVNVTLDSGDITLIVNGVVAGLAGTEVNYTGPVLEDGSVELIEGDDYTSRPFVWTISGYTGPSLSGAAAVLRFIPMATYNLSGSTASAEVSIALTLTQSGSTVTVSVAPTAAQLAGLTKTHPPLPSPNYKIQVRATSSNVTVVLADATRRRLIGAVG